MSNSLPSLHSITSNNNTAQPTLNAAQPTSNSESTMSSVSTVWTPENEPLEKLHINQDFIELAKPYIESKKRYVKVSAAHETAHLEALAAEMDPTIPADHLAAAVRKEQQLLAEMDILQNKMAQVCHDLGLTPGELEAYYNYLTTNISFANNPRYRNLRAALRNLYPGTVMSNDDLEALIRGNVYLPNNNNENTENIRAKKLRARNTLAAVRGGRRRRSRRQRRTKKSRK